MNPSDEFFQRSQRVSPGGVHSPVRSFKGMGRSPVFFEQAHGAHLVSADGDRYIDFCQSFGPLLLGHRDADVAAKVEEMMAKAWSFGAAERYSLELAEWMVAHVPHIEKVRFVNSGTEAVMSALRVARAATGRSKILKFEGCYHGHVDSMLVKAGSGLAGVAASDSAGVSDSVASETLVCPLDDEAALNRVFEQYGDEIAAVIIEPLPANFGLLIQRQEFLAQIQSHCRKSGSLLIFDEVISGFRVALGGMAEKLDIKPDLVTYGKVIGGGFPVGCYAGRADLMDLVAPKGPVYQAGTLSANPIGMVAGLATLNKVVKEKVYDRLESLKLRLVQQVEPLLEEQGWAIASYGSLFWIHLQADGELRAVQQIPAQQTESFNPLFLKLLDKGIYLSPNAYEVGFLSTAHDEEVIDEFTEKLGESLS